MQHIDQLSDLHHADEIISMMEALYAEDKTSYAGFSTAHFPHTVRRFIEDPRSGMILRIWNADQLAGYALLVPYWSNEFGGNIVFIDELFVRAECRGKGLASSFLEFIDATRPFGMVACMLETTPSNDRARRLYERAGFQRRENQVLFRAAHSLVRSSQEIRTTALTS